MNHPTSLSRLIVLDIETSGLDPALDDVLEQRRAQISALRLKLAG